MMLKMRLSLDRTLDDLGRVSTGSPPTSTDLNHAWSIFEALEFYRVAPVAETYAHLGFMCRNGDVGMAKFEFQTQWEAAAGIMVLRNHFNDWGVCRYHFALETDAMASDRADEGGLFMFLEKRAGKAAYVGVHDITRDATGRVSNLPAAAGDSVTPLSMLAGLID
jgi:hypothetical protein